MQNNHKIIIISFRLTITQEYNLETPDVFKLFQVLTCFGYDCEKLPLSINEAVDELTKTIEGGKGHVHLHIYEHTHRDVNECLNNYNHH